MKNIIRMIVCIALFECTLAFSQNPVPDPDTLSTPVQEGDPALQTLPPRLDYVEDRKLITPAEVPDALRQTLESDAEYSQWREATLYRDQNKDEYIVEFNKRGKTTTYRFDKEGRPILQKDE